MTKVLILDIETTPNIAYVWRFFKENIGTNQIIANSNIMSFAAKWLGHDDIVYVDTHIWNEKYLLETLNRYLDEADVVITHYGNKFDLPRIRARSMALGISPPSPYKCVDTCAAAKKYFSFERNTLDYIAKVLGCDQKMTNRKFNGFELWREVLANNPEAWKELQLYNKQDVIVTEQVYLKMRPWITTHPNIAVYEEDNQHRCPKCNSSHVVRRGFAYTNVGKYQRFKCNDCGGWSRTRYTELEKEKGKALLTNANG